MMNTTLKKTQKRTIYYNQFSNKTDRFINSMFKNNGTNFLQCLACKSTA